MTMGTEAAERCDDFGWQPRGAIDPRLVAETTQHPRFGIGRAWSSSAGYQLSAAPKLTYLVYTVEGGFDFTVDGSSVHADAGSMILLDGEAPTTAQTTSETARFVWYFEPSLLRPGSSRFRFHEPIPMRNASLRALIAMTHSVLDSPAPRSDSARWHLGISLEHLVSGALDEAGSDEVGADSRHQDGLFMAAQLAVETHFRDPAFSVTRLARELSVSVRTIHGTFSRLGTTPRREIERRRITEVGRLSAAGTAPAAEIADRVGFSSSKQLKRALARSLHQPGSPAQSGSPSRRDDETCER
ncbi:helix-turn-helix domain-containing protein [Plantibacter sp. RU18]|uniref:helix-turn-helix domain-containing protein n=1 Tax=Plantibacter sp. RU18 TaxID=3158143 RepID=UPI003D3664F0